MEISTMQGYFIDGIFYQQGRRTVLPERQLVIVNILDIPINTNDIKKADIEFWEKFDKLAHDSVSDNLNMDDFPRADFNRDSIID